MGELETTRRAFMKGLPVLGLAVVGTAKAEMIHKGLAIGDCDYCMAVREDYLRNPTPNKLKSLGKALKVHREESCERY